MESKKINQLATEMTPTGSDLTIIGDPITGVSRKITLLQLSATIGTGADLQGVTDNGATTTNPIAIGGLTITGLATGVLKSDSGVISSVPFGAANGVATLGGDGKVPSIQLPSYVDDVVEVANFAALPVTGETGKIYITLDNNKVYRWTGSIYVEIAANNAVWGAITGTLSNQTDLQNALNAKQNTITLTTTGTSGASTLVGSTLNIPNYSTDLSGYVPYTGATTNVNLGTHSLSAKDLIINHTSGSGVAASITKGGNGEALTVVKSSGSGNAASITGGVTLLDELHLTTDLADAYIASAATWNAKQNAITLTTTGTSGAATLVGATLNIPNYADQFVGTVTSVGLSSATSGVTIGSSPITTSGTITLAIATASGSQNGLLSSTDWTTFNGKQAALNGTGFVKISGTTISYDNSTYLTTSAASSTYLPLSGGTLTGALNGTSAVFSGSVTASQLIATDVESGVSANYYGTYSGGSTPLSFLYGSTGSVTWNNGGVKMTLTSAGALQVTSSLSATSATLNGNVTINSTAAALSPLQVVATGTIVRLGEQSGTTGKQFLIGIDATSGRTELQSVWQGTSFTSLALQPSGGNVLIGTTTDNGARLQVSGTATFTGSVTSDDLILTAGTLFGTGNTGFSNRASDTTLYLQMPASGFNITDNALNTKFILSSAGAATFSSSITAGSDIFTYVNGGIFFNGGGSYGSGIFQQSGGTLALQTGTTPRLTIASTGLATFSSSVAVGDSVSLLGELYWGGISSGQKVRAYPTGSSGSATLNFAFWNGSAWGIQGSLTSAGVWSTTGGGTSDARTKNEIDYNFDNGIESILKLQPTKFKFKISPNKQRRGFIAQDVLEVIPDLVLGDGEKENGTYGLDYDGILAIAVKAIQELKAEIDELKNK